MSANDPLDAVFVTGDESRKLHEEKANNDLSRFIKKMPVEYRARIGNELAQLRATLAQQAEKLAEYERIKAMLPYDESMTLFQAVENLMHDDSADEIIRQAAQLEQAQTAIREARQQLRATQRNWDEDCLYRADEILSKALGEEAQRTRPSRRKDNEGMTTWAERAEAREDFERDNHVPIVITDNERAYLNTIEELRATLAQQAAQADDTHCPLCTWRGPVELVNGVCPQCGVDWPKKYAEQQA